MKYEKLPRAMVSVYAIKTSTEIEIILKFKM